MAGTKEGAAKAAQKRRDKARERREARDALLGALVSVGGRPSSPERLRPASKQQPTPASSAVSSVASVQRSTDGGAGGASVVTDGRPMGQPMATVATDGATDGKTAEQPAELLAQSPPAAGFPEGTGHAAGLDSPPAVATVTVDGAMHPVDQVIDAAAYEAAWLLRKTIASGKASLSLRIDAAKKALELRQRRLEAAQKPGVGDAQGGALAALAAALGPVMARRQAVAGAVTVDVLPQPGDSPSGNSRQQPDS